MRWKLMLIIVIGGLIMFGMSEDVSGEYLPIAFDPAPTGNVLHIGTESQLYSTGGDIWGWNFTANFTAELSNLELYIKSLTFPLNDMYAQIVNITSTGAIGREGHTLGQCLYDASELFLNSSHYSYFNHTSCNATINFVDGEDYMVLLWATTLNHFDVDEGVSPSWASGLKYETSTWTIKENDMPAFRLHVDPLYREGFEYKENGTLYTTEGSWSNVDNAYDGDWGDDSFGADSWGEASSGQIAYLYVNYSVPYYSSQQTSYWEVQTFQNRESYSIPADCWNISSGDLAFRIESIHGDPNGMNLTCWNTTHWNSISLEGSLRIYEEAMWWGNYSATTPTVGQNFPLDNNQTFDTNLIGFEYVVSNAPNITNCSLMIDNSINLTTNYAQTNKTGNSVVNNLTVTLQDGDYNWAVNCTDVVGNMGGSGDFNISVNTTIFANDPPTILSNTTTPSPLEVDNSSNIYVEINDTNYDSILYVNFTLIAPNGSTIFSQENGTFTSILGDYYINYTIAFTPDDGGQWNMTYYYDDNSTESDVSSPEEYLFTISDTNPPTLNITSPFNNSDYLLTDAGTLVDFNFTYYDDLTEITSAGCWYVNDTDGVNISIDPCANVTINYTSGNHNLTFYANDSFGNVAEWFANFSVSQDATLPEINITQPTGTKSSRAVIASYNITDNGVLDYCYYNITLSTGASLISNRKIFNCATNNTLVFDTGQDASNMVFWIYANDTFGNENFSSSTFSVSTGGGTTPGGGGGGGGGEVLKAIGESCTLNEECITGICDTNNKSIYFETCQLSLCGNGVIDEGENRANCPEDVTVVAQLIQTTPGNVLIGLLGLAGVMSIIFLVKPKLTLKRKKKKKS